MHLMYIKNMESIILPISPQGQITIPKKWRDILIQKRGVNKIQLTHNNDNTFSISQAPEAEEWLESLRGSAKDIFSP